MEEQHSSASLSNSETDSQEGIFDDHFKLEDRQNLSIEDLFSIKEFTTTVQIANCRSEHWEEIGEWLARFPSIASLTVSGCQATDELLYEVAGM